MSRKMPSPPTDWQTTLDRARQRQREETLQFRIQVVTPLFGGGVEPGEPDPITLIRPTSIRGHLRFWWRMTKGASPDGPKKPRQREMDVWGSTEFPSPVEIEVDRVQSGDSTRCAKYEKGGDGKLRLRWHELFGHAGSALPYVLFPFQGQLTPDRRRVEKEPAEFRNEVTFSLRVRCPTSVWADVKAALRAWVNFGGIGARTRRGCGALFCEQFAPRAVDHLSNWFSRSEDTASAQESAVLGLVGRLYFHPEPEDALAAWNRVIKLMRDFRQGVNLGRNPGGNLKRPGRSRWPEPEAIRRATGRRARKHQRLDSVPDDCYPRAELGLPIVCHFKDRDDPDDTLIVPVVNGDLKDRMASPLILKPLVLSSGKAVAAIVWLNTDLPAEVALKKSGHTLKNQKSEIERKCVRSPALSSYPNSPLGKPPGASAPRSPAGSAIEAFLNYAREKGFREAK